MKKISVCFFIFLFATQLFAAKMNHYEDLMKIKMNYLSNRQGFQYVNKVNFLSHFDQKSQKIEKDDSLDDAQKSYLVSLALFESIPRRFFSELSAEQKKPHCMRAKKTLKDLAKKVRRWEHQKKAVESDVFRLLGDLYSFEARHCVGKNMMARIPRYRKSLENFEKAIQENPQNMLAQISFGAYKYSAPKIGGGDVDVAIQSFRTAIEKGTKVEKFLGYAWLSVALWKKNNDMKEAKKTLKMARDIFPNTKSLGYFEAKIGKK